MSVDQSVKVNSAEFQRKIGIFLDEARSNGPWLSPRSRFPEPHPGLWNGEATKGVTGNAVAPDPGCGYVSAPSVRAAGSWSFQSGGAWGDGDGSEFSIQFCKSLVEVGNPAAFMESAFARERCCSGMRGLPSAASPTVTPCPTSPLC